MPVLDPHPAGRDLLVLRDVFDILAVRHGADEADMQLHQEVQQSGMSKLSAACATLSQGVMPPFPIV
jgi:hypothetical protein